MLPKFVRELSSRLGARPDCGATKVTLRQSGTLRADEASNWLRFSARQSIEVSEPCFDWRARVGPLGVIHVTDRIRGTTAEGAASIFGLLPIARTAQSPALLKAEIMRYLAEIAWAPDAILANRHLSWEPVRDRKIAVSTTINDVQGRVIMSLDHSGLVQSIDAKDRPRLEGKNLIERPWRGDFGDYRPTCGRIIPHRAEVSWLVDGFYKAVWRGNIVSWAVQ